MMPVIEASNAAELQDVSAAVHDLWFRPEDVIYDHESSSVTVALTHDEEHRAWFGLKSFVRGERRAGLLRIDCVSDCHIIDDAEVGSYTINYIECEAVDATMCIRIFGNAPLRIEVTASRIAVRFDTAEEATATTP
jgi:hypothetical protein